MLYNKSIINVIKSDYFILFLVYSLSHGLLIINNGIYWDDWLVYNHTSEEINSFFYQIGNYWFGWITNILILPDQTLFYLRFTIFISYFASGIIVYKIIPKFNINDDLSRICITIFFMILPFNQARISIMILGYSISHFLFYLAFYLLIKYYESKKILLKIISILFFFISFSTNSLIVFFFIPFLLIVIYDYQYLVKDQLITYKSFIYNKIDLLLLPMIFWIIKLIYFMPNGIFAENYNKIKVDHFFSLSINIIRSLNASITSLFSNIIDNFYLPLQFMNFTFILIIIIMIYYLLNNKYNNFDSLLWKYIYFGIFSYVLAVTPYLLVGRLGVNFGFEWQSRDQLLIPLGFSFLFFYFFKLLFIEFSIRDKSQKIIYSIIIATLISSNINNYLKFQIDSFKQQSIMEYMIDNSIFLNNTSFVFEDRTLDLNAFGRTYRFYEYTGMMKKVFNDDKRFGINSIEYDNKNHYKNEWRFKNYPQFNFSEFDLSDPQYRIIINRRSDIPSMKTILILIYNNLKNKDKNNLYIRNMLSFSFNKIS